MSKNRKLEIVLPIYNEESILEQNTLKIKTFLEKHNFDYQISIVDTGSIDSSYKIAKRLEEDHSSLLAFRLKDRGRGRALRYRLLNSEYPVIGYMDIDLSTSLTNILELYTAVEEGYDMAIGSRLLPDSKTERSFLRDILSRFYCKVARRVLNMPFKDYQCGCKLFRKSTIISIIDCVENNNWFFDTELIFCSYIKKMKIIELPVSWIEDRGRKSKVKILSTINEDIRGIVRLRRELVNLQ